MRQVPTRRFPWVGIQPYKQSFPKSDYRIVGFDTETVGDMLYTIQLCYKIKPSDVDPTSFISYFDKDEIPRHPIRRLLMFPRDTRIFAHNLPFDLNVLLEDYYVDFLNVRGTLQFVVDDCYVSGYVREGQVSFANFKISLPGRKTPYKLNFYDSGSYFRGRLGDIGKMLGLKKMPSPLPRSEFGRRYPKKGRESINFKKYALRDAELEYKVARYITDLYKKHDINLGVSTPHFSSRIFRRHYLDKPIPSFSNKANEYAFNSYFGGRTECYLRGFVKNINVYDVNSLYSYAAIHQSLPFSQEVQWYHHSANDVVEMLEQGFEGVIKAGFHYNKYDFYPCVPNRETWRGRGGIRRSGSMVFPLNGYGCIPTPEVRTALKEGCEFYPVGGYLFYPTQEDIDHPLKQFMLDFYDKKSHTSGLEQKFNKLILNSLVGKFGQKRRVGRKPRQPVVEHKYAAGSCYNPFFASLILSRARVILHRGLHDHNAFYCDTDSIFTTRRVPTSNKIGKWKLEASGDALLVRNKFYLLMKETQGDRKKKYGSTGFGFVSKKGPGYKVIKEAHHGVYLHQKWDEKGNVISIGDQILELLRQNHDSKDKIKYKIERFVKGKESLKRGMMGYLVSLVDKKSFTLKPTRKKRVFKDKINWTYDEMMNFVVPTYPPVGRVPRDLFQNELVKVLKSRIKLQNYDHSILHCFVPADPLREFFK